LSSRDRITIPEDMSNLARDSEREFAATGSDVRPILPMRAVPWMVITYDQVQRLPLDSRAGFVISLIDGKCTVEMILDISGMPEDETLDILRALEQLGAIELRGPR
jgi:hypothetical protein